MLNIHGYFQQLNPISERLVQRFYSVGITKEELKPYLNVPDVIEGKSNLASQKVKDETEKVGTSMEELNDYFSSL